MDVAKGAGSIHLRYFKKTHRIIHKPHAGIVTEADKESEKYILKKIFSRFPESSIITEESGAFGGNSLVWIIDPLDGTSNYAHGFPWFCVSIGVWDETGPRAGVIYNPVYQETFYAEKDQGAYFNSDRIHVSATTSVKNSLLGTGFYYSKGTKLRREIEIFRRVNERALGVRRPGSAALDLAYVACGRYDGFWERGLSPWDIAAGWLLVEEAGGFITDYAGKPTSLNSGEIVASNSQIHRELVSIIGKKKRY